MIIPGAAGEYGVTMGHSPVVAEMKPGVLQILHGDVSCGYVFFILLRLCFYSLFYNAARAKSCVYIKCHVALTCTHDMFFYMSFSPLTFISCVENTYCIQGKEPEKFFVSAGFALTHPTSVTDVTAIEAVRVEEIDADAVSFAVMKIKLFTVDCVRSY